MSNKITPEFRKASQQVHELHDLLKTVQDLHLFRWKYFVDSSPRGEDCSYARASAKAYLIENEHQDVAKLMDRLAVLVQDFRTPDPDEVFRG